MEKITIKDVAEKAGVSVTSVSRVLNDRGYLSTELKEKVMAAIEELNYTPNEIARSFFKSETRSIALIVPTSVHPFFSELTFHIENELSELGYHLYICNSLDDPNKEKEYLKMLSEKRVDGIIVGSHNMDIQEYDNVKGSIVSIERKINEQIPMIESDNYLGGKLATEELVNHGCKKIICITGDQDAGTPANNRVLAYSDVILKNNLKEYIYKIPFNEDREVKIKIIEEIFKDAMPFDGIFAGDDLTAQYVIQLARSLNIHMPEDLLVVGFDGTELIRDLFPEFITVVQPLEQMANKAVKVLIDSIKGKKVDYLYTFPVVLSR